MRLRGSAWGSGLRPSGVIPTGRCCCQRRRTPAIRGESHTVDWIVPFQGGQKLSIAHPETGESYPLNSGPGQVSGAVERTNPRTVLCDVILDPALQTVRQESFCYFLEFAPLHIWFTFSNKYSQIHLTVNQTFERLSCLYHKPLHYPVPPLRENDPVLPGRALLVFP
jgi:hypothetical protein